jgi:tetratricopeptide (TPR) repeat protein
MTRVFVLLLAVLTVAAGLVQGAVTLGRRRGFQRLRGQMGAEMLDGSLQALLRARVAGTRVALAESGDVELAGELAYVDAVLAMDYGLHARGEAEQALARADGARGAGPDVARGWLALGDGQRDKAEALALAGMKLHRDDPRPALLLARVRLATGDVRAAGQALDAAMVKGPRATAPTVAWAETRLDFGQPAAALSALNGVVARSPHHTRARLLQEEAALASGARPKGEVLDRECLRDATISPVVSASCTLRAATAARLRGDRQQALIDARNAAAEDHRVARVLADTALALAQLGRIDEAAAVLERVTALVTPAFPAAVWAEAAVSLGRGELPVLPPVLPGQSERRLLVARAALAAGGPAALARALQKLGRLDSDPDLRALALLLPGSGPAPHRSPVRDYAEGLRARLAGDAATAARSLASALDGHGDACRAAGEYLAVLRQLRQTPGAELDALRAADHACINLALPPPAPARVKRAGRPAR